MQPFDEELLQEAIQATFSNRGTHHQDNHILFSETFPQNEELNQRWNNFLKKINYEPKVPFAEMMRVLTDWLKPYWEKLKE